ncbi:MAG: DsbA family protein [Polaromonas sp.]|uniref:DsbA family protein n=1 Tax=Polaromonas sp. TaxID=1869339 RepID=UPI0027314157|nr:DsbA family protein [Polaromonas sp.]MDP2452134.1 DsbA family protein [Polaromonas sp.]MDP3246082.1 DsbA family protein [Polaromonas sp.]MDP3828138.1 DsbA family protein [Polaromonas sp.]
MTTPTPALSLIYVGDPMCSWCYGFGVPLGQLLERFPEVPVQLVLGGLRAYNTQVMDAALKDKLRNAWAEVGRRSGQPFSQLLLEREDFIYDTEPACRAVVTARQHAPALALHMYHAIQQAFYAQGRDVTKAAVLAEIWDEVHGRTKEAWGHIDFLRDFESEDMRQQTRNDFLQAQRWGVRGFPTLLVVAGGQAQVLTSGYAELDLLVESLTRVIAAAAPQPQ